MTLNPEETKSKNNASNMECTCSLYAPRLSENSQDQIRMSKRDACTSPTIPSPNNMTYTTRKGTRSIKFIVSDWMMFISLVGKRINLSQRFLDFCSLTSGTRNEKDFQQENRNVAHGYSRSNQVIIRKASIPTCCVADVHTAHLQ